MGNPGMGVPGMGVPGMGGNLSQGTNSSSGGAGMLQGNERFLRQNRRPGDFVGKDLQNRRHFIGSQQGRATGRAQPSTTGLHISPPPVVNQPAPASQNRKGPYHPPLEAAFDVAMPAPVQVSLELARHLRTSPGLHPESRVAVSVEGRTAILRGTVACESDRAFVEQMALFEPGISAVRNDLQVRRPPNSDPPPAAGARPADPR
jgi:hypothetical protein